ncbi:hypothetical protein ElyMa_001622900 [Elysia marginata]|uniref:Uncharacterized protein n=1 Tax=Elysia marginata TaxID=1093978 RepID=A0AAV4JIX8_9GAST|nr:hypothetical protein ElyMa_001622900 [Elysia marginata]
MTLHHRKTYLDLIRDIAENRDERRAFIAEIRRGAAEAVRSDDPTSKRLKKRRLNNRRQDFDLIPVAYLTFPLHNFWCSRGREV